VATFVLLPAIGKNDKLFSMELRHLRYFCAVAEERSFTAAARRLNASQSGLSGQVRDLEREIGVLLLRRDQREVSLTPEGSAFLQEAKAILTRAEQAVNIAVKASQGEFGKLSLGLCGPVTAMFLPKLIRAFRKRYPAVTLSLKEYAPFEQVKALINGDIDLGFTRTVPAEAKHLLKSELLFREPLIAAIPKDHPLAGGERISLSQLAGERLVLFSREAGPDIFDSITAMCKRARFTPKVAANPNSWQSVLTLVEAAEGIALVPACVQQLRSNDVVFRPLRDARCLLDAIVVWRRNETDAVRQSVLAMILEKRDEWGSAGPKIRFGLTA
jgi:DNA-binding transcriptional LysR family regulator